MEHQVDEHWVGRSGTRVGGWEGHVDHQVGGRGT